MAPRDRGKRQRVVDEGVAAALTSGRDSGGSVVDDLVRDQIRAEQESERKSRVTPSERRRRQRQLPVTFSVGNEDVPDRLREVARRWGLYGPDGRRPSPSAVVEYLLLPRLEAAERGEIAPPSGTQRPDSWT
jgi:hypothetical protein